MDPEEVEEVEVETPAADEAEPEGEVVEAEPTILDQIFGDNPPDSVKALEAIAEKDGDFKVSAEDFANLSLEAKQLVTNLRRMSTRTAQAAAEARKTAESERKAFEQEKVRFAKERAALLSMFQNEKLTALLKEPEGEQELDPFSEEGRRNANLKDVREFMRGFMGQMGTVSEEYQQVADQHLAEVRRKEERVLLTSFIEETDDWSEYADETAELVDKGMHWKDAYLLARARRPPPEAPKEDPVEASRRRGRRRSKVGGGGAPTQRTLAQLQRDSSY